MSVTKEQMQEWWEALVTIVYSITTPDMFDKQNIDAIRTLIENGPEVDESAVRGICEAMLKARSMGGEILPILSNWLHSQGVRIKEGK